jgi:hypothetical protein
MDGGLMFEYSVKVYEYKNRGKWKNFIGFESGPPVHVGELIKYKGVKFVILRIVHDEEDGPLLIVEENKR